MIIFFYEYEKSLLTYSYLGGRIYADQKIALFSERRKSP